MYLSLLGNQDCQLVQGSQVVQGSLDFLVDPELHFPLDALEGQGVLGIQDHYHPNMKIYNIFSINLSSRKRKGHFQKS